jgi:type IV secretory pathway VirB10-like protein
MAAQPPGTFLICMAKSTPEATEPNLSDAASVLRHLKDPPPSPLEVTADSKNPPPSPPANAAHLKDPPPSPPESTDSDTKRPPGDTNPRDNVAKRSSRKLRAQQQAFDRVTVVHSASEDSDSESSNANVTVTHGTSHAWTLPTCDYWEPQSREYQKFKASSPEASHQLTQQEVNQKYRLQANKPWRRLQVIQKWGHGVYEKARSQPVFF